MKLLYCNVIEQNRGWGAEWFLNQALHNSGVDTVTIDYRAHRHDLAVQFAHVSPDVDAFVLQRGDGFPLELLDAVKRPRFFIATELVARRRDQDRLFSSGLFSHVFVRGTACKKAIIEKGWLPPEKISIFLSAFDPGVHKKQAVARKDIDVLFVGALTPRRRRILAGLSGEITVSVRSAFGAEMSDLFNRAKIVLNIHAADALDTETRVFEALGSGAFLLSETLAEENPFTAGVHFAECSSVSDIVARVRFYLAHEAEREAIAAAGYAAAHAGHTYEARARQLCDTIRPCIGENKVFGAAIDESQRAAYARREPYIYAMYQARMFVQKIRKKLSL